jgi:hypothetical protein
MKNKMLIICFFVFLLCLSISVIFKNISAIEKNHTEVENPVKIDDKWMNKIALDSLILSKKTKSLLPDKYVLIFSIDSIACSSCVLAETSNWQQWVEQDSLLSLSIIKLICTTKNEQRWYRDFLALGIKYDIWFDRNGTAAKSLNIKKTPEVFFCYKGRVMHRYIADINDPERTRLMQEKFSEFLKLP